MKAETVIYRAILFIMVWAPLPLGSHRPWALSLLMTLIFVLSAFWLVLFWRGTATVAQSFRSARMVSGLLAVSLAWTVAQGIAIPLDWLSALSPAADAIYQPIHGWEGFQSFLSVDPSVSAISALQTLAYLCFFCLLLLVINTADRLKTLALVVVISGVFQAFFGATMTLSGVEWGFFVPKDAYLGTATGTFVNRNHLAGYLEMALSLGIGLMLVSSEQSESRHWKAKLRGFIRLVLGPKGRLRLGLVIMVIALVLTRSRMGNTAFFASLMVTGSLALWLFKGAKTSTMILLASLLAIDILIVGTWFGVEKVANRLQNTTLESEERDEVDDYALAYLKDYWLTGSGAGTFIEVLPRYKKVPTSGLFDHAHNDYLEFSVELGLLGFLPLAAAVSACVWAALTAMRKRHSSLQRGMGFACLMGMTSLLIHSFVDFNLQIPANALLFLTLMALSWVAVDLERKSSREAKVNV